MRAERAFWEQVLDSERPVQVGFLKTCRDIMSGRLDDLIELVIWLEGETVVGEYTVETRYFRFSCAIRDGICDLWGFQAYIGPQPTPPEPGGRRLTFGEFRRINYQVSQILRRIRRSGGSEALNEQDVRALLDHIIGDAGSGPDERSPAQYAANRDNSDQRELKVNSMRILRIWNLASIMMATTAVEDIVVTGSVTHSGDDSLEGEVKATGLYAEPNLSVSATSPGNFGADGAVKASDTIGFDMDDNFDDDVDDDIGATIIADADRDRAPIRNARLPLCLRLGADPAHWRTQPVMEHAEM